MQKPRIVIFLPKIDSYFVHLEKLTKPVKERN